MKEELKLAVKSTSPVFFGYIFAGMAFGLMLQNAGYSYWWALLISCIVYAGSMQFILVTFLSSAVSLPSVMITTLAVNSRHMFYGLSFIEKFKKMGRRRWYMIFSLTDETYSLLCSVKTPEKINEKNYLFLMALFNQSYWICGCVMGAVAGTLIHFDTTGVDFAMTALFLVTFVEQWLEAESHSPAMIGLFCGFFALMIFGKDLFILPSLLATVLLLLLLQKKGNQVRKGGQCNHV